MTDKPGDRLLFVGPMPPPVGGYTTIAKSFVKAWQDQTGHPPKLVNTSPGRNKNKPGITGIGDIVRGLRIGLEMCWKSTPAYPLLVLLTVPFFQHMASTIRFLRDKKDVPVLLWFSGGTLHEAIASMEKEKRHVVLQDLQQMEKIIVETNIVWDGLRSLGLDETLVVPNPRPVSWNCLPPVHQSLNSPLQVLFFGRVIEEKGVFVLIDAVEQANRQGCSVECEIYGPIDGEIENRFNEACNRSRNVKYGGIVNGKVVSHITQYDVLALPTWFPREGHPGAIVEAMMAGIPVIATDHMALPEIVEDGTNGRLVEPQSVDDLSKVLCELVNNPTEYARYAQAHRERLVQHDAATAVRRIHRSICTIA